MTKLMDYVDNYKIVAKIGEGGMGDVYKGFEEELEREVAIKFLKAELNAREDIVQRFKSEAIALAKMKHSHIATVYKLGRLNDQSYIVMEFVQGETLADILDKEHALPWQTAVQYALEILEGLAHAHSLNIVHRDIKPSNLMVTGENTVKILDFGIARILDTANPARKMTRHALGTFEYMSPEQIRVTALDARSDIYSVGAVLYQMLTGRLPFEKSTDFEMQQAHVQEIPKSPNEWSDKIPLGLAKIVLKALEKQPEDRFFSALEFADALRQQLKTPQIVYGVKLSAIKQFCLDYPAVLVLSCLVIGVGGIQLKSGEKANESASPVMPLVSSTTAPRLSDKPGIEPAARLPDVSRPVKTEQPTVIAEKPLTVIPDKSTVPKIQETNPPPPIIGESKPPKSGGDEEHKVDTTPEKTALEKKPVNTKGSVELQSDGKKTIPRKPQPTGGNGGRGGCRKCGKRGGRGGQKRPQIPSGIGLSNLLDRHSNR